MSGSRNEQDASIPSDQSIVSDSDNKSRELYNLVLLLYILTQDQENLEYGQDLKIENNLENLMVRFNNSDKKEYSCLQAELVDNIQDNLIDIDILLNKKQISLDKDGFNLRKYCSTYLRIKDQLKSKDNENIFKRFIIFTNAGLSDEFQSMTINIETTENIDYTIPKIHEAAKCYKINQTSDVIEKKDFSSLKDHLMKNLKSDLQILSEELAKYIINLNQVYPVKDTDCYNYYYFALIDENIIEIEEIIQDDKVIEQKKFTQEFINNHHTLSERAKNLREAIIEVTKDSGVRNVKEDMVKARLPVPEFGITKRPYEKIYLPSYVVTDESIQDFFDRLEFRVNELDIKALLNQITCEKINERFLSYYNTDPNLLTFIIEHFFENWKNEEGVTTESWILLSQKQKFIKELDSYISMLKHYEKDVIELWNHSWTGPNGPLITATKEGNEKIVNILLKIVKKRCPDMLESLLKIKDIDNYRTALQWASSKGCDVIVAQLLESLKDNTKLMQEIIKIEHPISYSAFHIACSKGYNKIVLQLFEPFNSDRNELLKSLLSCDNQSALHFASDNRRNETVKLLLKLFENDKKKLKEFIKFRDNDGFTALHLASQNNHESTVALLLEPFKDNLQEARDFIKISERGDDTPLHLAFNNYRINDKLVAQLLEPFQNDPEQLKDIITTKCPLGNTLFHLTCYKGNENILAEMIKSFKNNISELIDIMKMRCEIEDFTFPDNGLHLAVMSGNDKVVAQLLSVFENDPEELKDFIKIKRENGDTNLHIALRKSHDKIVTLLLEPFRDDINELKDFIKLQNITQHNALHSACYNYNDKIMSQLLELFKNDINELRDVMRTKNYVEETALHIASLYGNDKMVSQLLAPFSNDVNEMKDFIKIKNNFNCTALHKASISGQDATVAQLLAPFEDDLKELQDFIKIQNKLTGTALHMAAKGNSDKVVAQLLKYFQDNTKDLIDFVKILNDNQDTAIHIACEFNYIDVVAQLLEPFENNIEEFKDLIKIRNKEGRTALHFACDPNNRYKSPPSICFYDLLEEESNSTMRQKYLFSNADILFRSILATSPKCNDKIVSRLLEPFFNNVKELRDFIKIQDKQENTALHLAFQTGNDQILAQLLEPFLNDAEDFKDFIKIRNKSDGTALHLASVKGKDKIVAQLLEPFLKDVTELKDFIKIQNYRQATALHLACHNGNDKIVELLLEPFQNDLQELKEFLKIQTNNKFTALHLAAENGENKILSKLLKPFLNDITELKDFIKIPSNIGVTALHLRFIKIRYSFSSLNGKNITLSQLLEPFLDDVKELEEFLKIPEDKYAAFKSASQTGNIIILDPFLGKFIDCVDVPWCKFIPYFHSEF